MVVFKELIFHNLTVGGYVSLEMTHFGQFSLWGGYGGSERTDF